MLKKLYNWLLAEKFFKEARAVAHIYKKAQGRELEVGDLSKKELPKVERYIEPKIFLLRTKRAAGDAGFFLKLSDTLVENMKATGLFRKDTNPNGPFSMNEVEAIADILKIMSKSEEQRAYTMEEGVEKIIGKEMLSNIQSEWPNLTSVVGFDLVLDRRVMGMEVGLSEVVGFVSTEGDISITQPDLLEREVSHICGDMPDEYYKELRQISQDPTLTDDERDEKVSLFDDKWKERYEEACRRDIESFYPPDVYEGSNQEIPIGQDIEEIESDYE